MMLAAITLVTVLAFAPAIQNGFTGWDDPAYVTDNQLIRDPSLGNLRFMFSTFFEGNYHPLTMASLATDYRLWRLNPKGYHTTNVVLHVLGTWAVFWLILLLTGSVAMSAITALFFGIHPVHVESVAWISGRKDLLYALFYLCACISYVKWVRGKRTRSRYYLSALVLFVFALLSKGMAVTLPVALILIDLYLDGVRSVRRRLLEKVPFFLLSVAFGVLAISAQKATGAIEKLTLFPIYERVLFAFYSMVAYLVQAFAPVKLSAFYPYPHKVGGLLPATFYVAPLLAGLIAMAVYRTWKHTRGVAFGTLFYLLNVALVLQLLPLGSAMRGDRYTYLSYVGVGFILAEGYRHYMRSRWGQSGRTGRALAVVLALFGGVLFANTRARCEVWKDNLTLWGDVIHKYPDVPLAYTSRAVTYEARGEHDRAIADLDKALALNGNNPLALCNRGIVFLAEGNLKGALEDLDKSVALDPSLADAWHNRGVAHARLGNYRAGIEDFDKAIGLKSRFPGTYLNRANAHYLLQQFDQALRDYDVYIKLSPGNAEAYFGRGLAKFGLGDASGAVEDYASALGIDPRFAAAYSARSHAFMAVERYEDALRDALQARGLGQPIDESYLDSLRSIHPK